MVTKSGRGRISVTTPTTDRAIKRLALCDRAETSFDIVDTLQKGGVVVSARTVQRRLVASKFRARRPSCKPLINPEQCRKWVVWTKEHLKR